MYKRIVVAVASVLFILLAFLSAIITDLYDRDYPQAIGVENRVNLDFSESNLSINEAFATLEELDTELYFGLLKVTPDLTTDDDKQVFAMLSNRDLTSSEFTWFNGKDAGRIVGKDWLANSYPDGDYLITGENDDLGNFERTLINEGVQVSREDTSIFSSLKLVVYEKGFAVTILAAFALIVTLALFWLSVRSRGRALRVLNGTPALRIQMQDLAGFGGALLVSAVAISLLASIYVGVFHGWIYVGIFLKAMISLQVIVIALSLLVAFIMSATAWPSAVMLATRQPAVKSLRTATIIIQALTFLLVVAAASPAWSAYKHSSSKADEMAQWKLLSDQVAIEFATDIGDMKRMEPRIGKLVKDAESQGSAALSYTFTEEMQRPDDFGEYSAVSFVNERWLEMVTKSAASQTVTSVPKDHIPKDIVQLIQDYYDLWSRNEVTKDDLFTQFKFMRPKGEFQMPVAVGGGDGTLDFADDVLLVVVPSIYNTYDDSTLTSMISTANVMFTEAPATQRLLKKHNLDIASLHDEGFKGELNVVYIAENGILIAQYMAYIAWLQNLSLIVLVVAFTFAAGISALITARLQAKSDFPLRLAGRSWSRIIQSRVIKELLVGAGLVGIIVVLQKPEEIGAILAIATYGLLVVPLSHLFAARWCFNGVSRRRI